jgi:hypothetical protein
VTDEFRTLAPGVVIGKSFYSGPQEIYPQKWRKPRDTNFFMLFQVQTSRRRAAGRRGCGFRVGGRVSYPGLWRPLRAADGSRPKVPSSDKLLPAAPPQACTADGKIAWQPEQRELPLIGDP